MSQFLKLILYGISFLLFSHIAVSGPVFAQKFKNDNNSGVILSLYKEQSQNAFYMLVPKGWKTEGGMISSGVAWNVVDLVENNIRFRVTSPDGQSFFGWYPRFYFQEPQVISRNSGGMLQPQIGQVINGCWVYPYLDVANYVQYIVFAQLSAGEFKNPSIIGNKIAAPELKPLVPQLATRKDYGFVNFECTVNGTPTFGRIYSINYDIQGIIWSTVGTFGWLAPKSRREQDERLMEICIRSFRLNPDWVKRASAAARNRANQYHQVIQEMNRIDQEINQRRSQVRSDIQEEFYKVITEQIETYDPETSAVKYLPMYNHAWTDGKGNYFLRDFDDGTLPVEDASQWRKLKIINRNDPEFKPKQ